MDCKDMQKIITKHLKHYFLNKNFKIICGNKKYVYLCTP